MSQHRTLGKPFSHAIAFGCCFVALSLTLSGCGGPKIPPEELGEVLTELPKLPKAEKPYEHPELVADGLDVPAAKSEAAAENAAAAESAAEASAETAPTTPEVTPASPNSSEPSTAPESGGSLEAPPIEPK